MVNDRFAETGLKFFGTVSASISHEIKNRMAVINEQAGLLKDMVHLAGQGRELPLERLMRLAESLKNQVDLTDGIIRNMNRFAHSVDSFQKGSNLNEILSLTAELAKRTVANRGGRIELRLPEKAVSAGGAPFLLMNLAWLCLEAMMPYVDRDVPVQLGCEKRNTGAAIWLSTGRWPEKDAPQLPETAEPLMALLGARIILNPEEKVLGVELPGG